MALHYVIGGMTHSGCVSFSFNILMFKSVLHSSGQADILHQSNSTAKSDWHFFRPKWAILGPLCQNRNVLFLVHMEPLHWHHFFPSRSHFQLGFTCPSLFATCVYFANVNYCTCKIVLAVTPRGLSGSSSFTYILVDSSSE